MKKILAALLIISSLLGLCACKKKDGQEKQEYYEPVKSTEEESRVVMNFTVEGDTYNVRYELYRALFVGNRNQVDNGDISVWGTDVSEECINAINEIIIDRAAEIYSTLHLALSLGISPYSKDADAFVQSMIKLYVKGGTSYDGTKVKGYGSYDKFLSSLKKSGMNYAVCELMFRHSYAVKKINEYYIGKENVFGYSDGKLTVTDEALSDYYYGEDCVRVLEAHFQEGTKTEERVEEIRDEFYYAHDIRTVAAKIIQYTTATSSEVIDAKGNPVGKTVGRHELDGKYYREYISEAFSLSYGEVSEVIRINNANDSYTDGYYILVGVEKTEDYFKNNKQLIRKSYINNEIGRILNFAKDSIIPCVSFTENLEKISYSELVK